MPLVSSGVGGIRRASVQSDWWSAAHSTGWGKPVEREQFVARLAQTRCDFRGRFSQVVRKAQ